MDKRIYIWIYKDSPAFIAINDTQLNGNEVLIPIGTIKSKDYEFTISRAGYSITKSKHYLNYDELSLMEGPDLYVVTDKNNNNIIIIWFTKTGLLELSVNSDKKKI